MFFSAIALGSDLVRKKYGVVGEWEKELQDEVFKKEKEERVRVSDAMDELVTLGILRVRVVYGGNAYDFTGFGYKFLERFIRE